MRIILILSLLVLLFSCSDDAEEFSPSTIVLNETEGWIRERIVIQFDNPDRKNFEVKMGTLIARSTPLKNGLQVTIPWYSENEVVSVTIKTPAGERKITTGFLIKGPPRIAYARPLKVARRIPLKLLIYNENYFKKFDVVFWGTHKYAQDVKGEVTRSGDTLLVRPPTDVKNTYKVALHGTLSFDPDPNFSDWQMYFRQTNVETRTYPSFQHFSISGVAGSSFGVAFDNTYFQPRDIRVVLKGSTDVETVLKLSSWMYIGGPGYQKNQAFYGRYIVPNLPAGEYKILVTDEWGYTYLPEIKPTFRIAE